LTDNRSYVEKIFASTVKTTVVIKITNELMPDKAHLYEMNSKKIKFRS
jgi:hypothetical protein